MSTYSVKPCLYDTASGEKQGYLIVTKELSLVFLDLLPVNRCLHEVAIGSDTTCRQYAYRICRWLNWLEERGKSYRDAFLDDIGIFMTQLLYNITSSVIDISEGSKSPHTLEGYFAAIRRLYVYLQRIGVTTEMKLMLVRKKGTKESFSYGLSFATVKPDLIIDRSYKKGKKPIPYIKWYTDGEKEAILSQLRTLRDKTIFSISLDGARIDEILSFTQHTKNYDPSTRTFTPSRSKRKRDDSEERTVFLSDRSVLLLRDYITTERLEVITELASRGKTIPSEVFLNHIRNDDSFGKPVKYDNSLKILKRAAAKAGLDPKKIRTHSGRSTCAQEVVRYRMLHPDLISDQQFLDIFGWTSPKSKDPYINRKDPLVTRMTADALREARREKEEATHD